MNELMIETMESGNPANGQPACSCPMHAVRGPRVSLDASDELVFPMHKRVITQYSTDASGVTELHLYYGEKEISFDEPELFAFGEALAGQPRFVAGTATRWGEGYDWLRVRELLEQLIEEGILRRADAGESDSVSVPNGVRPSPLPPAQSTVPRTWFECEAIIRELTGRPVELGYLELVIPIYRVAHIAMDAEGRQVGEANVFPPQLRLDVPTEWRTCQLPGSRYLNARPMNVSALKSMRKHWTPTMVALLRIREAYLRRFPGARDGWTVGDLQRLSALVLTVPAYLLMRTERRVENGDLHPVLSSMFRVTDGVRMTMHNMLFIPVDEPTLPPDAPMTSSELYAYAERTNVFLSETGVCSGPQAMIEEFLNVLINGQPVAGIESTVLDAPVQAALAELEPAIDYGLYGLQAHAVVLSLWPAVARAYERLLKIFETWPEDDACETRIAFRKHLRSQVRFLRTGTLLGTEEWRVSRERVLEDMYAQCGRGMGTPSSGGTLPERIAPVVAEAAHYAHAAGQLRAALKRRFCGTTATHSLEVESLVASLMDYFRQEQAIVRAACEIQGHINRLLRRTPPARPFTASDISLFYQMQGSESRPPYLVNDLDEVLGLRAVVTQDTIEITDRTAA